MPTKNALFTLQDDLIDRYNSKDDDDKIVHFPVPKPTPEEHPEDLPMVASWSSVDDYIRASANRTATKGVCTTEHTTGYPTHTARLGLPHLLVDHSTNLEHENEDLKSELARVNYDKKTWFDLAITGWCIAFVAVFGLLAK